MKILIIKPSSLGDVVQALPVLRLLRRHWPKARIDWWLAEGLFPLLEDDPDLDDLIPFTRVGWNSRDGLRRWRTTICRIRDTRYDLVIDLQGLLRSGLLTWLSGGAHTIGLDLRREGARLFYDVAVPRPTDRKHAVDWYLDVARSIGLSMDDIPASIPLRPQARDQVLKSLGSDGRQLVALIPGARWENKRWPTHHFAELATQLDRDCRAVHFAVLGGGDDSSLAKEIIAGSDAAILDLTGGTSLPELVEWLRASQLVITNDTGPMHIAAALGKPVVGLFGPTDPLQTGPYGGCAEILRIDLPCAPCMKGICRWRQPMQCLRDLTPDAVAGVARTMLG